MIYAVIETYNDRNSQLWFVDLSKFDDGNESEAILKKAIIAGANDHYIPDTFIDRIIGLMPTEFLFRATIHDFPIKIDGRSHIWQN